MTADEFNAAEKAAGRLTDEMLAVAASAGGIVAFQQAHGLVADGKAGMKTQAMLEAVAHPSGAAPANVASVAIPKGQAGIEATYGKFAFSELGGGRIAIDSNWVTANICSFTLHTGKTIKLHRLVGAEFVQLFAQACAASGYTPSSVQTFVPRHTLWDPAKSLSLHSWGIAIDFTPGENTMGGTDGHGGPSKLRQHPAFVEVFKKAGWTWGGDWKMKDDMHFQRAGS